MKRLTIFAALFFAAVQVQAASHTWKYALVSESGLAYANTYPIDLGPAGIQTLTANTVQSSATFVAKTFTDGTTSTGTIVVSSTQPLVAVAGSDTITVLSTSAIQSNAKILFNGYFQFNNGGDWSVGVSTNATAISIAQGINSHTGDLGITASTSAVSAATYNKVTVKCASAGSFCNAITLSVVNTSSITVATPKFTGGQDNAQLCINGTCLVQGTAWISSGTVTLTAASISSGIINSPILGQVLTSTNVAGVVYATSTIVGSGVNYSLVSSTNAALTVFKSSMKGGTASAVITGAGELFIQNHGYTKGLGLLFTKTAGTPPQDLTVATTYYVVPVDANNFKLATSSGLAAVGTSNVRLSTQTATGGGSYTLTPTPYLGTPSWKWQVSADNSNWQDFTTTSAGVAVSSVTYSSPAGVTSNSWDFGPFNYQYIRLNVLSPTQGGVALTSTLNGKAVNPYRP